MAIAAASVLGVTLLSAQQTGALWRAEGSLAGGTINSGVLDLTVGKSGSASKDFAFTALGGSGLGEGDYSQAPLTIKNSGNVLMKYRLQNSTQSSAAMPLSLKVTAVPSAGDCPAQGEPTGTGKAELYNGPMIGAQAPSSPLWQTVEAGQSEILCLRGTVGAGAPPQAESSVQLSFTAESR